MNQKFFQYFDNVSHDVRAPDTFHEVVRVMFHSMKCRARLILPECYLSDLPLWLEAS